MPWKKGQSGNPGGRPKQVLQLVELARGSCEKAIKRAAKLLDDVDPRVAIAAATFIRDTGMGRPPQAQLDLATVTDEELVKEVRRRAEAREAEEQRAPDGGTEH